MKKWHFWLGLFISLIFVYWVVRGLEWEAFWVAVISARYWWLVPGVALYLAAVWARAWRWHYLLRPVKQISTNKMFPVVCIGYMGNNIYPARAGEVLRAVILKRREGVPVSASLATVIVERIFDGVVMLAFVFLNLPELARINSESGFVGDIQTLTVWGAGAFFGALGVFLLAAMFPQVTARVGTWFIERLTPHRMHEKILGIMHKFLDGLASLRSPFNVLMVFVTSTVIWLLETGKYWFVMHAFDFEVSFFALMLMNGIVNLATTLPGAPGYVGTFDGPGIAVLQAYGVDKATATGYTLVLHVALWIVPTVLGAYFMMREGIHWSDDLRNEAKDEPNSGYSDLQKFYDSVVELIDILKKAGHNEWAGRLNNALVGGATSSEILGNLRIELMELQSTSIPNQIGYKEYVDRSIRWVTNLFDQTNPPFGK